MRNKRIKISGLKSGDIELYDMVFFNSGFLEVIVNEIYPSKTYQVARVHCNLHKAV
jgi:hypothetical protein